MIYAQLITGTRKNTEQSTILTPMQRIDTRTIASKNAADTMCSTERCGPRFYTWQKITMVTGYIHYTNFN